MENMDHNSKQKTLITKSLFLKHVTQLLLSVSLLSLFVTNFSRLSFLCSFNSSKFSSFPIQLFTHTLNKNYTFLICNGILVFVAKISSSRKSSQGNNNPTLEPFRYYDHHGHEAIVSDSGVALLEKQDEDDHVEENADVEKGRQDEDFLHATREDGDVQEEERYFIEENEEQEQECELDEEDIEQGEVIELDEWSPIEEDEDEGNGVLSTEELNKRFDEFIKKMKEGLRIEAQQQYLVMVN